MIVYGHADKRCCCRTDWGPTVLLMNGRAANARNPHVARNTTFPLAPGAVIAPCWIDNRVIQCSLGCAAQMVKWMDTNFWFFMSMVSGKEMSPKPCSQLTWQVTWLLLILGPLARAQSRQLFGLGSAAVERPSASPSMGVRPQPSSTVVNRSPLCVILVGCGVLVLVKQLF